MAAKATRIALGILLIITGHFRIFGVDEPCTVMVGWIILVWAFRPTAAATTIADAALLSVALAAGLLQLWVEGFFVSGGWHWAFLWLNGAFIIGLWGWQLVNPPSKRELR
jgi:hypothetical protein